VSVQHLKAPAPTDIDYRVRRVVHNGLHGALILSFLCKGKSSKFAPHTQKVGLNHLVQDEDVVSSQSIAHDDCLYSSSYHL